MTFEEIDKNRDSDVPEPPEDSWDCIVSDCGNDNTSEWEYLSYVAANNNNNNLSKDKVDNSNGNSWVMGGYFTEEPTVIDEGYPVGSDCIWGISMEESEFRVHYPDAPARQTILKTAAHNPDSNQSDSSFSFSLSLFNVGIGLSAEAFYPGVDLTADSYEDTTWKFDYGLTGESDLPTSPEDSIGVRWDFEGQDEGTIEPEFTHDMLFETRRNCGGPETIYTGMPALSFNHEVEVVDGN